MDKVRFSQIGSAYDRPEPKFDANLTLVGRGTPMGELLRRYWLPVSLSSKATATPAKVRVLGEDLILFRKPSGECGLVYPRCAHRGTSLFFGKVTERGIRCGYHGWVFDTDGRCVFQQPEPDGGRHRDRVRQPWYPVQERYGLVFAYLGPLDRKPELPYYDILDDVPEGWEIIADDLSLPSAGAGYMPCNWLQHHENGIDPHHVPVVHEHQFPPMMAKAKSEHRFERHHECVRGFGRSELGDTIMHFEMNMQGPLVRSIPDPLLRGNRPDGRANILFFTVPKDDTDTVIFGSRVAPRGFEIHDVELYDGKRWSEMTEAEHQRLPGDFETQVGQGPITFHSEEHLGTSDRGIMMFRQMLREGLEAVREGRDPAGAFGSDPHIKITANVRYEAVPTGLEQPNSAMQEQ